MKNLFLGILFFFFIGCGDPQSFTPPQSRILFPDAYQDWFQILGSDQAVQDYIIEVLDCHNDCLVNGAEDSIVLNPINPEPCVCIYKD